MAVAEDIEIALAPKTSVLSPLNQRRWRNFRANSRAFWSLVLVYVTAWAVQGSILARNHLTPTTPYDGSLPPPPPPGATVPDPMRQPLA